ncbi:MAG: hypothetical protein HY770_01805, partial [Chitinivibrionia bacterium]|nr:hypothetical protein [Chitinivibrionia bacterium]
MKPHLFQGNASGFALTSPAGATTEFTVPEYSFQQLQDNREWGWNIFQWHFWTPFNKDNPDYVIRVEGAASPASVAGKAAFIVDPFGQDAKERFEGRVGGEEELVRDVEEEKSYYESLTPPLFDRFGGLADSAAKMALEKTGFFHVEKKGGAWVLVDPDGNAFFHLGVCAFSPHSYTYVKGRESTYEWMPPRDGKFKSAWNPEPYWNPTSVSFHLANMIRKYGGPISLADFQDRMIERVRKWGFNSIGAFSEVDKAVVAKRSFPYVAHLPSASDWNGIPAIPGIRETFDPFDEKVKAEFDRQCGKLAESADDPLLIGYFVANEPTHEAVP